MYRVNYSGKGKCIKTIFSWTALILVSFIIVAHETRQQLISIFTGLLCLACFLKMLRSIRLTWREVLKAGRRKFYGTAVASSAGTMYCNFCPHVWFGTALNLPSNIVPQVVVGQLFPQSVFLVQCLSTFGLYTCRHQSRKRNQTKINKKFLELQRYS